MLQKYPNGYVNKHNCCLRHDIYVVYNFKLSNTKFTLKSKKTKTQIGKKFAPPITYCYTTK